MNPTERYQNDLQLAEFSYDPAQEQAVRHVQRLYDELLKPRPVPSAGLLGRLLKKPAVLAPVKGLYFWGGVGRGKTYLVDCFYECLPFEEKQRIHFHRFMHFVHDELKKLKKVSDPLQLIADEFASKTRVLVFDEFHVADITDAMLLGGLFQALFDRGVSLVTTSNQAPDQLYSGGLQRQRFLPAIELIKQHTEVINVDGGIDYRLRTLESAEIYHSPLDQQAEDNLNYSFEHLAPDPGEIGGSLEIEGRQIPTVRHADGVVWFEFDALCGGPRSSADYIEIAREYQSVLISNLPSMGDLENDRAKRLMTLIDEFYDRNVKVVISAEVPATELYTGRRLAEPFQRTVSRLQEMQSHEYLMMPHLP